MVAEAIAAPETGAELNRLVYKGISDALDVQRPFPSRQTQHLPRAGRRPDRTREKHFQNGNGALPARVDVEPGKTKKLRPKSGWR
jgi:hypothetical protein